MGSEQQLVGEQHFDELEDDDDVYDLVQGPAEITSSASLRNYKRYTTLGLGEIVKCGDCMNRNNAYVVWDSDEQNLPRASCINTDTIFRNPCRLAQAVIVQEWDCVYLLLAKKQTLLSLLLGPEQASLVQWLICPSGAGQHSDCCQSSQVPYPHNSLGIEGVGLQHQVLGTQWFLCGVGSRVALSPPRRLHGRRPHPH
ncbi:hypothetical protein Fcan01_15585, partial [Folsomia candida]